MGGMRVGVGVGLLVGIGVTQPSTASHVVQGELGQFAAPLHEAGQRGLRVGVGVGDKHGHTPTHQE